MITIFIGVVLGSSVAIDMNVECPSLYEYYRVRETVDGNLGLTTSDGQFLLNGKLITIASGAIHYFRVHPDYWRDRLRKLRAVGMIAVETYVPWNLHEIKEGVYDFGDGGNDMSIFLDIGKFLQIAKEEDLFVILRPGPYICAEWDFGGMPSYLLRSSDIKVRTTDPAYLTPAIKYMQELLSRLKSYQIHHGGPIIMVQIENEYGHLRSDIDKSYLEKLLSTLRGAGYYGLFFTSDTVSETGDTGALPEEGVLITTNFQNNPEKELNSLKELQPDEPAMVMEYWTGWFNHWSDKHRIKMSPQEYATKLAEIFAFPASVNLYMFHGGTNFGFMSGANGAGSKYHPDITSYDYDAPLSENGDYTEKYNLTESIVKDCLSWLEIQHPERPPAPITTKYDSVEITHHMTWDDIVSKIPDEDRTKSPQLVNMELLDVNDSNGQSYGYTLYRQQNWSVLSDNPTMVINAHIRDVAIILIDKKLCNARFTSWDNRTTFGYWESRHARKSLSLKAGTHQVDLLVENMGRTNFGQSLKEFDTRKGLFDGNVKIAGKAPAALWDIVALQFNSKWVNSLNGWEARKPSGVQESPMLLMGTLVIHDNPTDTYLDMSAWMKGIAFVNGFNLGRYHKLGPQQALYIPAPLLKRGDNKISCDELQYNGLHVETVLLLSKKYLAPVKEPTADFPMPEIVSMNFSRFKCSLLSHL